MNDYTLDLLETKIKRIKELEEENKKLNELVQFNVKTTITLTKRINKAIEYINKNYDLYGQRNKIKARKDYDNLLDILKGEEMQVNKGKLYTDKQYIELLKKRVKELEEENKTLKELNVCVGCDNNPDYKSRIDKAIEYIIERYDYQGHALTHTFDKDNVRELLKILKGEEE